MINPNVTIEAVTGHSHEVAAWTGRLMPQLDSTFSGEPLAQDWVERFAASPHHDLFVARYTGELSDEQHAYMQGIEGQIGPADKSGPIVATGSMTEVWGAGFGRRGQLEDFVTDKRFRRLGIGREMFLAFGQWCLARGMPEFYLQTEEDLRPEALAFYESMGGVLLDNSVTFKVRAE